MPTLHHLGRFVGTAVLACVIASCAALAHHEWEQQHGKSVPVERDLSTPVAQYKDPEYYRDIKPIFDRRCVVCHGCYDAPCQLKLSSFSGVNRGASQEKVYDGSRLIAENLTRLFIDAQSADEWRQKSFYPVLNENRQDPQTNLTASTLYQMLELKRLHPLPSSGPLPDSFDFSLDRNQQCTRIETFDEFARKYPQWGMPYGMPAIEEKYYQTIKRWLETGAKVATPAPIADPLSSEVKRWEAFLNGNSLQQQLMSRYIFEHLFLGDFYFAGIDDTHFFKLVRSRTPPGTATEVIATRRPFDDPGVARVYYRLEPIYSTLLVKSHMPYALNQARMDKWRGWFLRDDYVVHELPSYDPKIASNPFKTFHEIPVRSRYRLMLDEAQFTIMGFIKGPVCRGQVALNVINDQFWVVFTNPDTPEAADEGEFLNQQGDNLRLPAEAEGTEVAINWLSYSRAERAYLEAKTARLEQALSKRGTSLSDIWNGDGNNDNAALTVFRHFDSATVAKGFVGSPPKTGWVVGYALLERIHYLLVAGYDVYGTVGHQLLTRMYMDFLRMEGEFNFLTFLPEKDRLRERQYWYRDVSDDVADYVYGPNIKLDRETSIPYHTDDSKLEFFNYLQQHFGAALSQRWTLHNQPGMSVEARNALSKLQQLRGEQLAFLPKLSLLSVDINGKKTTFTLLHHSGHANVSTLLFEHKRLLPAEDTVTLVPGILGAYPAAFFDLNENQLPRFVLAVSQLASDTDFTRLVDDFGIRRNAPGFWAHSDWLHEQLRQQSVIEAGVLDFNRLENR